MNFKHLFICFLIAGLQFSCMHSLDKGPTLYINGKELMRGTDTVLTCEAGTRLLFSSAGMSEPYHFSLTEKESGLIWYEGAATNFSFPYWAIRKGIHSLEARFSSISGTNTLSKSVRLEIRDGAYAYYPGLVAHIIRTDTTLPLLPGASQFKPRFQGIGADHPSTNLFADYPVYRTSESVLKVNPFDSPGFHAADYWRLVLPQPSFGCDEKKNISHAKTFCHPLGDLNIKIPVAALLDGFIMIQSSGVHTFHLETTVPARLAIGGQSITATNSTGTLDLNVTLEPGLAAFQLTLDRRDSAVPASSYIAWREPGQEKLLPLDGGRLLHRVPAQVEAAYSTFSAHYPWRSFIFDKTPLTDQERKPIDLHAALLSDKEYQDAYKGLLLQFKKIPSVERAKALLSLLRTRITYLREDKSRIPKPGAFGKLYGPLLQHIEETRAFTEFCMSHPLLQEEALALRAELLAYASIIHSRSFFKGHHFGANDGYSDNDNFIVNCWRGARAFDSPVAFDAARSLYDNHFTYCEGTAEGLHTDGVINFHSANGRQINMGAYGHDWVTRLINPTYFGTPWGNTQEQFRRVAKYVLEYEWFYYGGAMAFTANGRHNTHVGYYRAGFEDRLLALPTEALSPQDRRALTDMRNRVKAKQALEGNRFYFRHLLSIHRRADYYIDVKMNAPLVGGVETFAGATPGNLSFADGVTTLLRKGDEYRAIHRYNIPDSLWRFRSLPGTTQSNYETANLTNDPDRYRAGAGAFAGGVSDGAYGHCAFEFVSHPANATRANKFFGFTEDGMVVLAAGVTAGRLATTNYSCRSNVNQTSLKGPVKIVDASGKELVISDSQTNHVLSLDLTQRYWIEHAGIGYLILPTGSERGPDQRGKLVVSTSIRTPSNRIAPDIMAQPSRAAYNKACEELTVAGRAEKMLEISIDHGREPKSATASYYVVMRPEKHSPQQWLAECNIVILSNTPSCQAMIDRQSRRLHAFFYAQGSLKADALSLSTQEPVSVMLPFPGTGQGQIILQDPVVACTRKLDQMSNVIHLQVNNKNYAVTMPGCKDPDDRYRGNFATVDL